MKLLPLPPSHREVHMGRLAVDEPRSADAVRGLRALAFGVSEGFCEENSVFSKPREDCSTRPREVAARLASVLALGGLAFLDLLSEASAIEELGWGDGWRVLRWVGRGVFSGEAAGRFVSRLPFGRLDLR